MGSRLRPDRQVGRRYELKLEARRSVCGSAAKRALLTLIYVQQRIVRFRRTWKRLISFLSHPEAYEFCVSKQHRVYCTSKSAERTSEIFPAESPALNSTLYDPGVSVSTGTFIATGITLFAAFS